jgi:hypothetical protein
MDSPFEGNFDNEKGVKGNLEEILSILQESEVDATTLHSVTLPAYLWFDVMQACAVSGSMLLQVAQAAEETDASDEAESCFEAVEKTQVIYNDIYDSLVRLSKQVSK